MPSSGGRSVYGSGTGHTYKVDFRFQECAELQRTKSALCLTWRLCNLENDKYLLTLAEQKSPATSNNWDRHNWGTGFQLTPTSKGLSSSQLRDSGTLRRKREKLKVSLGYRRPCLSYHLPQKEDSNKAVSMIRVHCMGGHRHQSYQHPGGQGLPQV